MLTYCTVSGVHGEIILLLVAVVVVALAIVAIHGSRSNRG